MKKARSFLVLLISAAMVLSLSLTAFAADPGYEYYAGYQFTGHDPWGGELNVTVRSVEGGKMDWTFTDIIGNDMIYKEIYDTPVDTAHGYGIAPFSVEGYYSGSSTMSYNYSGTVYLADGKVYVTYESGETFTYSSEGGSSSRHVAALPGEERTTALTKYLPSGGAADGWLWDGCSWYYSKNGEFLTGWLWDGGAWYYLTGSGAMATGWINDGGLYYLTASGAMATGWTWDGTAWYYLNPNTGAAVTGWFWDDIAWYYMDPDTGAMVTGWVWDGNAWYYLAPYIGCMVTGQYTIDGVTYTFADNGVWIG